MVSNNCAMQQAQLLFWEFSIAGYLLKTQYFRNLMCFCHQVVITGPVMGDQSCLMNPPQDSPLSYLHLKKKQIQFLKQCVFNR